MGLSADSFQVTGNGFSFLRNLKFYQLITNTTMALYMNNDLSFNKNHLLVGDIDP